MKVRYPFLDVYRGVIVLFMVEGHVVRAVLQSSAQDSGIFRLHELFHGIIGPGFLFGAGITFGISAQRHWPDFLSWSSRFRRRLGKILLLLILGYMLHLPFFSLSKTLSDATPSDWASFLSFDVLQCIGFGLLLLHLLILAFRSEKFFASSTLALLVGVVFLAPPSWRPGALEHVPAAVAAALQGNHGSVYPLFPYAGFLFAGALVSYEFMKFVELARESVFIRRLASMGVIMLGLAFAAESIPFQLYAPYEFWLVSPGFFFMKLGCLFMLVSVIWLLEHQVFDEHLSRKHTWLVLFGVESLFVYVVHLILVYGWIVNPTLNISSEWSGSLGWLSALGLSVGAIIFLYGLAQIWNVLKENHPILFKGIVWWLAGSFMFEFFTRSY